VKVRNFRLVGQHPILGQAAVHFGSLRNQQELVGWYPLAGRTGRRDVETSPLSDWSRGSIKLRVQWIYTTPALVDYFLLLSERRLEQLQKSWQGMTEQLTHAIESDQRKREARDQLNAGRIKKLVKLQRKNQSQRLLASTRKIKNENDRENMLGKVNQGFSTSLSVLKGTLKASRNRYLYALYFQTVESKRNRQIEQEERQGLAAHDESHGASLNLNKLPLISEQKSPDSLAGSVASSKRSLENFFSQERTKAIMQSPRYPDNSQKNNASLDDFFSKQTKKNDHEAAHGAAEERSSKHDLTPRRSSRRSLLDSDSGHRLLVSHRRLSRDIDEPLVEDEGSEQHLDQWQPSLLQGQALYDGIYNQAPDLGISDLISVSTDIDEEARRKRNVRILLKLGYVFHESGVYFHENHLPNHFRRSLFASSMEERKSVRLYRPRFAVGTSSAIRHFKTWQAAGALHLDSELDIMRTDDAFLLRFKDRIPSPPVKKPNIPASKAVIGERLAVPDIAPLSTIERARGRVETMYLSRTRFERLCKRTLGSILNPGGWLTIRPITVLNLPDSYTGMFVKLRYGSEVLVSETVDAKVTPRWASPDFLAPLKGSDSPGSRKSSMSNGPVGYGKFKFNENDLHVHVEPQQTSGSIKLSVVAERLNTKTELGVLQIPLGAAIAACIDSAEDMPNSKPNGDFQSPPMYLRWFPLMNPRIAVPVEGDMGLSSRPKESEQTRDSMFQQYFAPCIQLALIWWPESNEVNVKESEDEELEQVSAALTLRGPTGSSHATYTPVVQSYFNADLGRLSVALIDSQRAVELLSFSAVDIDVRYSVTKTKTRVGLVVAWIQLDHQDNRAREPVVLAPTPTEHLQPTLQILALKDNLRTKSNIVSYAYIGVALQEMDLTVEESWIFELWDFFMGVMRRRQVKKNTANGQRRADVLVTNENCFSVSDGEEDDAPTLLSILEGEGEGGSQASRRKVYVEQLVLGLVKVNLSYVKGKKQSWELTDEGAKAMKNLEVKELPNLALAAGGVHQGNFAEQSEVFARWSQHTYDEDYLAENGGE
jgi:hypothetical protein